MIKKQLFIHNLHVNGIGAFIYCFGLSASRYIEYSKAVEFLLSEAKLDNVILELGCGYSILPSFWQKKGMEIIILDLNRKSLKWQIKKNKKIINKAPNAILADMRYIPLKERSISKISCISAIEHIPGNGDIKTALEIERILKKDGVCVISFPLSSSSRGRIECHWTIGIPPIMQKIFKICLPTILSALNVNRGRAYCERFFSEKDMYRRIIDPLKCTKEDHLTLRSGRIVKLIHKKIIPTGVLTIFDYIIEKFLKTSKQTKNADAIVLKLKRRKTVK